MESNQKQTDILIYYGSYRWSKQFELSSTHLVSIFTNTFSIDFSYRQTYWRLVRYTLYTIIQAFLVLDECTMLLSMLYAVHVLTRLYARRDVYLTKVYLKMKLSVVIIIVY